MNPSWVTIVKMLEEKDLADILHKRYSVEQGWCYLTDNRGTRYKITSKTSITEFNKIISDIRKVHGFRVREKRDFNP